ncbi:MAG TPA: hypothetical protein DCQ50_18545 [Chryseobacterium sp.]|nr:hypothetical protein [Chryseobacterium sp.]
MKNTIFLLYFTLTTVVILGQRGKLTFPLTDTTKLETKNVAIKPELFKNKQSIKVIDINPENDTELRIVKLSHTYFHNGTIEVELAGEPMKNSFKGARGFVGLAFRIDQSNSKFECIYLRPTNGRADDQIRRNHSVQYISYPDFPWYKLREEFPKKYETYVDLEVGKWTKVKIEVRGGVAKLFVHEASQPTLIVSDLKHGENMKGSIGLWIGPGTEAHFRNLIITKQE